MKVIEASSAIKYHTLYVFNCLQFVTLMNRQWLHYNNETVAFVKG